MIPESLYSAGEHVVGFFIVMLALTVLWALTSLLGRWFARDSGMASSPIATASSRVVADDDLTIVAAAAAAMIDEPHRLVSIRQKSTNTE